MSVKKAVSHLSRSDPLLGQVIDRVGPCRLAKADYGSTFEALARSIAYQQLSGKAAATIYGRFTRKYGDGQCPDPGRVSRAQIRGLRSAGLSTGKSTYIQGLARAQVAGDLPDLPALESMGDAEIIDTLVAHKGVGVWTVQMLLIFWLARPDVLAPDDLGIQKGLMIAHGLQEMPKPKELLARGECWRPYRSTACWYLWRACEL